jgi:RNA polymerase sigma factor for flagellar operon FliA
MINTEQLWNNYHKTSSQDTKEQLILLYAPLVKIVAGKMSMHFGKHIAYEDLVSYGIFGLIDAIEKFKIEKNVKFETYATLRIKGSIIDNIRKLDWVPRKLRTQNKQFEQLYAKLTEKYEREPTDDELAVQMGCTVQDVRKYYSQINMVNLVSLNEYLEDHNDIPSESQYTKSEDTPEGNLDKKELGQMLANALEYLNDNEKKVVTLYYYEEMTLKEISAILGLSESRISQIHSKSMMKLRQKLSAQKTLLF